MTLHYGHRYIRIIGYSTLFYHIMLLRFLKFPWEKCFKNFLTRDIQGVMKISKEKDEKKGLLGFLKNPKPTSG